MSIIIIGFALMLFSSMIVSLQINLDLTDFVSNTDDNVAQRHNCLYVPVSTRHSTDPHEIISYCLTEWSSEWMMETNGFDQRFTFADLSKRNISSRQLYIWSAPMDIIENYQSYLDNSSISHQRLAMTKQIFYNCTWPRFGPMCQYTLDDSNSNHLSLEDILGDIRINTQGYRPTTMTCYTHLQCDLGSASMCLGWTSICDGLIHCINGTDEEDCWQLEINQCNENEYRCRNGQCIPSIFLNDHFTDCLDRSDEYKQGEQSHMKTSEATIASEDVTCFEPRTHYIRPLVRSCDTHYHSLFVQSMFSEMPKFMSKDCWSRLICIFTVGGIGNLKCENTCMGQTCIDIINSTCPDMFYMPPVPVLFGHIYFAYTKEYIMNGGRLVIQPEYICSKKELCNGFNNDAGIFIFNDTVCRQPKDFPLGFQTIAARSEWVASFIVPVYNKLYKCNTLIAHNSTLSNLSSMYQCINSSKFIARERLLDQYSDCDYKDDEDVMSINNLNSSETHFKCSTTDKYISRKLVRDGYCDCQEEEGLCDDEYSEIRLIREHISFSTICDGFVDLKPILIDNRTETDETDCEQWPCNTVYTRCDGILNCLNGADELDCNQPAILNCPVNHLICVSPSTNNFTCLPANKINNGETNCLGATDESQMCRVPIYWYEIRDFGCPRKDTSTRCIEFQTLCQEKHNCANEEDQTFCQNMHGLSINICDEARALYRSNVQDFICNRVGFKRVPRRIHFSLEATKSSKKYSKEDPIKNVLTPVVLNENFSPREHYCLRGLDLRVWPDRKKNLTNITCLCPPSHYGHKCQYQNQRISLTVQFRTLSDSWKTPFQLVILLIDNSAERTIHSYHQLTYLSAKHCKNKYNIYLLYSTRPKNQSKLYSIHIDVFEKVSLSYRGTLLIPVRFPFLPVQRLAVQLNIPHTNDNFQSCSDPLCLHGRCVQYVNDVHRRTFCRCDEGWSGQYCSIPHTCDCSRGSTCLGIQANNRSLCVCPMNRWGSRCLLHDQVCQTGENPTCENGGQCVPVDEHITFNKKFECLCPEAFHGERCELFRNELILSFGKDIELPSSMLIHFIEVTENSSPEIGLTFKTIPINRRSTTIYWSRIFHIAFVELFTNNYYLITIQKNPNFSTPLTKTIQSSDRCPNINERFNKTIAELHLLRRIKYYLEPCQGNQSQLLCFFDDRHFCLCDQGLANCLEFNHIIDHNCHGRSNCENGAKCLQDSVTCPETSVCICPTCFYGVRCQFSSSGFSLSLDGILGYHIEPHLTIDNQPIIVKISLTLTVLIFLIGFSNGILCLITFKNRELHQVGCGLYLLGSSVNILFTMILFFIKFIILLMVQMTYVTNRSFLNSQCISIDFLLRIGLYMDQWLNAAVAIDRLTTVTQGVNFNKQRSKQIAVYSIAILMCLIISTNIPDPLHRKLIDEENNDEKRIWCIVTYSSGISIFNTAMTFIHFFGPFIINIISAAVIIISSTRLRSSTHADQAYRKLLHEKFQEHKHLLIAPILLVILAIPRLIISFVSGCMQSGNDSWLFLMGYYISFVPLTLTFTIFVLPSKTYKTEFYKSIKDYRQTIQHRVRFTS